MQPGTARHREAPAERILRRLRRATDDSRLARVSPDPHQHHAASDIHEFDRTEKGGADMGDKNPKSVQRQASQKQAKSDAIEKKKQNEMAARRAVFKKG
jgi:hypothetical protein